MPVGKKPRVIPPEIVAAKTRIRRGLQVVLADQDMRPQNFNVESFMKDLDLVLDNPDNWPIVVQFQSEIEVTVRDFEMSPHPNEDEIYHALDILDQFIVRGLIELGHLVPFVAGMVSGAVVHTVKLDPQRLAAVPRVYAKLRMELLGFH